MHSAYYALHNALDQQAVGLLYTVYRHTLVSYQWYVMQAIAVAGRLGPHCWPNSVSIPQFRSDELNIGPNGLLMKPFVACLQKFEITSGLWRPVVWPRTRVSSEKPLIF